MTALRARSGALSALDPVLLGLVVIGALNGWLPRLIAPGAPAVSLFAVLGLAVALTLARPAPAGYRAARAVAVTAAAALILAPSGAMAWGALALLALARLGPGAARVLLIALAATELFGAVGLNLTKEALLPFEARAAGGVLSAMGFPVEVTANVIALDGRLTVVAAGCSGAPGALFAALGAVALILWRDPAAGRPACALAARVAAACSAAANLARLSVMSVDATLYVAAHGQAGALATDLAASLGVAGAVFLAERAAR